MLIFSDSTELSEALVVARRWRDGEGVAPGRQRIKDAAGLWAGAGPLMVVERLRVVTHRCAAIALDARALSNTWWPVAFTGEDLRLPRLASLWLNSTLGLVALLMLAEETQGPWVALKKNKLPELPLLDPEGLADRGEGLLGAWDHLSALKFLPVAQLRQDPARATLDDAIAEALGIAPDALVVAVRELLGTEPRLQPVVRKPRARVKPDETLLALF